jgi:hypothetical protein
MFRGIDSSLKVCFLKNLSVANIVSLLWQMYESLRNTDDVILTRKKEIFGDRLVPLPLCVPQIPHGLIWDSTQYLAMEGRRLISRSMARTELWVEQYIVYTVISVTECGTIWLETGIWKLRGIRRRLEEGRYLLCVREKDSEHALLKCWETKQWREKFVCGKWLRVIETVPLKEVLNCAKVTEIKGIKSTCLKLGEHRNIKSVRSSSYCRLPEKRW